MWGIADTVRTIIAICVLHNMCLRGGDDGADIQEHDAQAGVQDRDDGGDVEDRQQESLMPSGTVSCT